MARNLIVVCLIVVSDGFVVNPTRWRPPVSRHACLADDDGGVDDDLGWSADEAAAELSFLSAASSLETENDVALRLLRRDSEAVEEPAVEDLVEAYKQLRGAGRSADWQELVREAERVSSQLQQDGEEQEQ